MAKFVTIGERLSTTAPSVNKAFTERDPEPILKRAKQQLDAGAVSAVNTKDIVSTKNESLQNMLTGKIAGLRVVQNSSDNSLKKNKDESNDYFFSVCVTKCCPDAFCSEPDH